MLRSSDEYVCVLLWYSLSNMDAIAAWTAGVDNLYIAGSGSEYFIPLSLLTVDGFFL
jgi:hypothetical protein